MQIQDIKKRNWNSLSQQEKENYCALDGSDLNFLNSVAVKQTVSVYYTPDLTSEEIVAVEDFFKEQAWGDIE